MDIVEKVADELDTAANAWALGTDNEQYECPYDVLARAAIRVTLEHYRNTVPEVESAKVFSKALAELDT